jgi:hypothetical protein
MVSRDLQGLGSTQTDANALLVQVSILLYNNQSLSLSA